MMFRSVAAALVVLAGTGVWAQSAEPSAPASTPAAASSAAPAPTSTPASTAAPTALPMPQQGFPARRPGMRSGNLPTISPRQRMQDMQDTLNSMHSVLKQMRAKAPAKDSIAKENLDMWELMVKHLEKQLQDLQAMTTAREDMEKRRAAMYGQADDKAAAAQAARTANAAKLAAEAGASAPAATPGDAAPVAPSVPAATAPAAGSSASPN